MGLLLLGAAVAEAQTQRTLVSNSAQAADASANTSGNDHAQLFHTGGHAAGYILTTVHVNSEDAESDDFDVDICEEDGTANEFPSTAAGDCTALTAPANFLGVGNLAFTHTGLALSANTNYVVVVKQRGTGSVELNGGVRTTMFGADYAKGPLMAGLMLSHRRGLGGYQGADIGQVASSVTGLHPWVGYQLTERATLWGVTGYGRGSLSLTPGEALSLPTSLAAPVALKGGLSMSMLAGGVRGDLVDSGAGGFGLAFKADALWVGTGSEAVSFSYDPTPSTPLGFTARVAPSWGGQAMSGADALWGRDTMEGLGAAGPGSGDRLDAEFGYALPIGSRLVGTPRFGVTTSEYGLGYSLAVVQGGAMNFEFGLDAQRRQSLLGQGNPDHSLHGRVTARW